MRMMLTQLPKCRCQAAQASYIAERAARADIPKALRILKRAGVGRRPAKGDELSRSIIHGSL
jgi:hypothetical protein